MQSDETTETYRLEQAVEQLREKEEYKAEVYDQTFEEIDNITDKKNVLVLLREKLSYVFLNDYKLVHIKEATYNKAFEKIWIFILSQWFSWEYETKLIDSLNDLILNIAMYKLDSLDDATKKIIKNNILEIVKVFQEVYTEAKKEKTIILKEEDEEGYEELPESNEPSKEVNSTEVNSEVTKDTWVIKTTGQVDSSETKDENTSSNNDWIYEVYNPYLFVVNYDNVPLLWDVYWSTTTWYL